MERRKLYKYTLIFILTVLMVVITPINNNSSLESFKPTVNHKLEVKKPLVKIPLVCKVTALGDTLKCYVYGKIVIVEYGDLTTDDLTKIQKFFESYK